MRPGCLNRAEKRSRKNLRKTANLARCICRTMQKIYQIQINSHDLGQLLDGLEARAQAWEKTADYHRTGQSPPDFIVEECNGADEADSIASHYRSIIAKIRKQREEQL